MTKPILIAVTGMPASGKSTCAQYLAKKKNVHHLRMSEFIWKWLEEKGIKQNNITGAMFGLYLHIVYKDAPIIRWAKEEIRKNKSSTIILLDSLRTYEEYLAYKRKYGERIVFIAVIASPDTRKERMVKRARFGDTSLKSFEIRDAEEIKRGIGSVIAMADYYVNADGSMNQMLEEVESTYQKILRRYR